MKFCGGAEPTVGVELELQLLDADTLDLEPGILPLLDRASYGGTVQPEYFQSAVEINTPVFATATELGRWLLDMTGRVRTDCAALGMRLCGAGTHPFCSRPVVVTPAPRYLDLASTYGHLVHHQITFATQIHVGMSSGDEAMRVMRHLIHCMPALVAVAANSPFWRGVRTAFASYRRRVVAASRSYGMPPTFGSWADFEGFMETAQRVGMADSVKDLHWDVRPQPALGTIEIRAADSQTTVRDTVALVAFVRALAVYLTRTPDTALDDAVPGPVPWWMARENHFRASHEGIEASHITSERGSTRPMRTVIADLIDLVSPLATEVGDAAALDDLAAMVERGAGYTHQLSAHDRCGTVAGVVGELADELDRELGFVGTGSPMAAG